MNGNEPFFQAIKTVKALFQLQHGRLREANSRVIDFGQQLDNRLVGAPGQGLGEIKDGVDTV